MKTSSLRVALSLALLVATLAAPAIAAHHLNGTWAFQVSLADGQGGTATITLDEGEEGALSGTYSGALGEQPVTGKVDGDNVQISFDSQAGTVTFDGQVQDDGTIAGSCTYGQLGDGTFTAEKNE